MSYSYKTISEEDVERFFLMVLETLSPSEQDIIRRRWSSVGGDDPIVIADPEKFISHVEYAATDHGAAFLFNLEKISDRRYSFICVIYHELAHAYLAETDKHYLPEYERNKEKIEHQTDKLAKKWLDRLRRKRLVLDRLSRESLISRFHAQFDLSPVLIGSPQTTSPT